MVIASFLATTPSGLAAIDKVLSLDGEGDYVDVGNDDSLKPTFAITLEAKIYPQNVNPDQHIISTGEGGPSPWGHDYYVRLGGGKLEFRINFPSKFLTSFFTRVFHGCT